MYELKVKNKRGEILNLSTSKNYTVYKIDGLQPPAVTINSAKHSTSDGVTVNSVSVGSRNIVIYMIINGDVEANRINLYKYFPIKQDVTVYFKNTTRDVCIEGVVERIECNLFSNKQVAQISLLCPQPYFKAVNDLISYFSEVTSNLTFPFAIGENGLEFSAITTNIRKSIVNVGDVESGVIIRLYAMGTVVNPVVYDVFNRTHIALNYTMETNDEVIINTNMGKKSITLIRNGITYNIMGYMSPDSTWITLAQGDNVFTYDSESGNSNLQLTFTSSLLYGGV